MIILLCMVISAITFESYLDAPKQLFRQLLYFVLLPVALHASIFAGYQPRVLSWPYLCIAALHSVSQLVMSECVSYCYPLSVRYHAPQIDDKSCASVLFSPVLVSALHRASRDIPSECV